MDISIQVIKSICFLSHTVILRVFSELRVVEPSSSRIYIHGPRRVPFSWYPFSVVEISCHIRTGQTVTRCKCDKPRFDKKKLNLCLYSLSLTYIQNKIFYYVEFYTISSNEELLKKSVNHDKRHE